MVAVTTKDHILDTATALFNETTTGEVSTNHIAAAAGMSSGNLYYHFPNKEAIIRAALERMFGAFGDVWRLPEDRPVTLADAEATMHALFGVLWRFRFFYREQLALMRRDPLLAARQTVPARGAYHRARKLCERGHSHSAARVGNRRVLLASACAHMRERRGRGCVCARMCARMRARVCVGGGSCDGVWGAAVGRTACIPCVC